jgi:hypothetical protein
MPSTVIEWYDSRRGALQRTVLPRALPQREIEQLQEYFQNTPGGVERTLRQMGQAAAAQSPAAPPPPPPPQRNVAEKISEGPYRGFTLDEVIAMAERGLLSRPSGEDSGSPGEYSASLEEEEEVKEEEVEEEEVEDEVVEEEVVEEEGVQEDKKEQCQTERETRTLTQLPSESSSPLVKLPVCRPPTPVRSSPDLAGERSWELRVSRHLTLERCVCTFEELLARLEKDKSASQV